MSTEKGFKFWVPAEIEKGKDAKTGKNKWVFKGIASTADEDTDGEVLVPQGFDLSYFLTDGFVNWNHQSKNNPSAIIGEPTKAEIRPEGMYVETELYQDSTVAKGVYELGEILEKSKSGRRLGFSIEGKVLEKDPDDDKKILRAKITGLAITPSPKNKSTFADIVKGNIFNGEWEFETTKDETLDFSKSLIIDITDEEGDRVTVDKAMNINIEKGGPGSGKKKTGSVDHDMLIHEEDHIKKVSEHSGVKEDEFKKLHPDTKKELSRNYLKDKSETEKALDTAGGAAITPSNFSTANPHFKPDKEKNLKNLAGEKLDTSKDSSNLNSRLTKSEVYESIFSNVTTDIEKAEKIYHLIEQIELKKSETMQTGKSISMDAINEAYSKLGINIEKGETQGAMTNKQADTNPAIVDAPFAGDANGYSVDMVMGMYKGMDNMKDKKGYMSKAIEKGVKEDMADKAYDKAVEKGFIKGAKSDNEEDGELKKAEDKMKKADEESKKAKDAYEKIKKGTPKVNKSEADADEEDDDADGQGDEDEDGDGDVQKGKKKNKKSGIMKGENPNLIKALAETGQMVKQLAEQNSEIMKALGTQKDEFAKSLDAANKKIEEISSSSQGRRSVQTHEYLEKGHTDLIEKSKKDGKKVLDLNTAEDSRQLEDVLYQKAIEKGSVDKFWGNLTSQVELGGNIAMTALKQPGVLQRIETDLNIRLIA